MHKKPYSTLLMVLALILVGVVLLTGCGRKSTGSDNTTTPPGAGGQTENQPNERYLRVGEAGGVELDVLWLAPEYVKAKGNPYSQFNPEQDTAFRIAMTTHSGDLLQYDLAKLATLRVGNKEIAATSWVYTNRDSHHPEGVLVFPGSAGATGSSSITLVIKGLGNAQEVSLNWEIRQ
ncbi:hypothetical protein SY88_14380 [Clostridiales bacterium PH28_bin88]|nr:hypothetical protein SY88_14380 [Clostridiales bacterium PH28_bin88]